MDLNAAADARLIALLEQRTGQQLAPARHWRIEPAIAAIVAESGLPDAAAIVHRIAIGDDVLAERVVEALLNHETRFFRDPAAFRQLTDEALPRLAQARCASRRLRIWSAGCSTGQEPYSLALAIRHGGERWRDWSIEILGTDVSAAVVARARDGVYSQFEAQRGLPVTTMLGEMEPVPGGWRIGDATRQRVRFLKHNLLDPPPAGAFDIVLCRNVLLYFSPEQRAAVLGRIAGAMAPDGVLMLGAGETVLGHSDAFVVDPALKGLYRARGDAAEADLRAA